MKNTLFLQIILGTFGAIAFWSFIIFGAFGSDSEYGKAVVAFLVFIISLVVAARAAAIISKREKK